MLNEGHAAGGEFGPARRLGVSEGQVSDVLGVAVDRDAVGVAHLGGQRVAHRLEDFADQCGGHTQT